MPVIPVAGGFQPRAAVGYMTVAALEVAAAVRRRPALGSELDVAAEHLEDLVDRVGAGRPDEACSPRRWPARCTGTVPVIAGAGLTTPIAYRWKMPDQRERQEPAYRVELPELDHNEIVGWEGAAEHRALRRRVPRRLRHAPAGQASASS